MGLDARTVWTTRPCASSKPGQIVTASQNPGSLRANRPCIPQCALARSECGVRLFRQQYQFVSLII